MPAPFPPADMASPTFTLTPLPVPAEMASASGLRFVVQWFGVLCHLFPLVSFLVTKDWKQVFYDCFGPEVLIADTITTLVILWHHMFRPKEAKDISPIILHTLGLSLNFMSICMFAMYQSLSGGLKKAKIWYYCVIGAFGWVTLLTFMWIHMGITIEKENDLRAYAAYLTAAFAEAYQFFWPAMVRAHNNFVNDEKTILWLKVSATTLSIVVSSCELQEMVKEGFWSGHIEKRFMVLNIINIVGGCLQLFLRCIGPERVGKPLMRFVNRCKEWMAEKLAYWKSCFRRGGNRA